MASPHQPILIYGSGSTARITALALAAGLSQNKAATMGEEHPEERTEKSTKKSIVAPPIILLTQKSPAAKAKAAAKNPPAAEDYQSVLALSPAAHTMLQALDIWSRLDRPSAPLCDMAVFGDAAAWAHNNGLDFNPPPTDPAPEDKSEDKSENKSEDRPPVSVLAHIVCRAALERAILAGFDDAVSDGRIQVSTAALTDFDKSTGRAHLSDGTKMSAALLVDCGRADAPGPWRQKFAARVLRHDYKAAALVCALKGITPHGGKAVQLFLPDGPLALLPLPDPYQRALIWSLPEARAAALQNVPQDIFCHELAKATQDHIGALTPIGPRATQKLSLALAETYCDERLCLLGEGAHIIHPLAGQGFNLALRDAAQLADALFDARRLGLGFDGPHVLQDYQTARRADGGAMAATTHLLAEIFSRPLARPLALPIAGPVARLGLALTGRWARRSPKLSALFRAQANGGTRAALPRLMRGRGFGPQD
jgi:2-octaprenyl-6-methoxyphenol hydroxylase